MNRGYASTADRIRAVINRLSRERVLLPEEKDSVIERLAKKHTFGNWWRAASCATVGNAGPLLRGRSVSEWVSAQRTSKYDRADVFSRLYSIEKKGRRGPLDAELCVLQMAIENHEDFGRMPYQFRRNTMKGLKKIGY